MNWLNLSKNRCPKCGEDLSKGFNPEKQIFICGCGFVIRASRMREMLEAKEEQAMKNRYLYK